MKGRVCMLHNLTIWRGGAERLLFTLTNHLREIGYEVDIYVLRDNSRHCFTELRQNLQVKPTSFLTRSRAFSVMPPLHALEMAKRVEGEYDVIHAHNFPSNMAALFLTKLRLSGKRVPYVWQCNEPSRLLYDEKEREFYRANACQLPPFECTRALAALKGFDISSKALDRLAATRADVVTTLSEFVAQTVRSLYGLSPVVINPGVDKNVFDRNANGKSIRDHYGIGDSPLIVTVSRLWPAKNVDTALKAFEILARRMPDAVYMIVGDGPSEHHLQAMSRSLGIWDRCIFVSDSAVRSELSHFYGACDVFLHTGIGEPWGLTVLEAMASGKPVVVSETGGPSEFVEHGRTGFLIEAFDPESFARALEELLLDRELASRMGKRAAEAAQRYSWERMASAYDRIYSSVMS